jgi:tyrosine-protein kinase Etk/Wzc
VRPTQLATLHVITTGALPKDAASLFVKADLRSLFDRLALSYDIIIIDVPPALAVGDAFAIARHATLNVLVLKHGLHGFRQVRFALARFDRHGGEIQGCIVNDVSAAAQRYAYRGYGYQYQYDYRPST